jgi:hypothetical protein
MEAAALDTATVRTALRSSFYEHLAALVLGNDDGTRLCSYLDDLGLTERLGFVVGRSTDLFWAWNVAPKGDARLLRSLALSFASHVGIQSLFSTQTLYQVANVHGTVNALARLGVTGLEANTPAPLLPAAPATDWMSAAEWCVQAQPVAIHHSDATLLGSPRLDQATKLGTAVYLSENNFEAAARLLVWRTIHCGADHFFHQAADFMRSSSDSQEAAYFLLIAQHAPAIVRSAS